MSPNYGAFLPRSTTRQRGRALLRNYLFETRTVIVIQPPKVSEIPPSPLCKGGLGGIFPLCCMFPFHHLSHFITALIYLQNYRARFASLSINQLLFPLIRGHDAVPPGRDSRIKGRFFHRQPPAGRLAAIFLLYPFSPFPPFPLSRLHVCDVSHRLFEFRGGKYNRRGRSETAVIGE